MNHIEKLQDLRALIADESITLAGRTVAAEHAVQLQLASVPAPAEDDAEVVELLKTWADDGSLGSLLPTAWKQRNLASGWSESGPTLSQARKWVHDRLRLRALLGIIVDEESASHRLERLEACRCVLETLHPRNFYRVNTYTPERMLAEIKPYTAVKWGTGGKVPVQRPPREIADAW